MDEMTHEEQVIRASKMAVDYLNETKGFTVNSRIMIVTHMVAITMLHLSKSPRSAAILVNEIMVPAIEKAISNYDKGTRT